jgi:dipeptidase E
MRLYLSSFRLGDHPEHLVALIGGPARQVAVIGNALDDEPAEIRRVRVGTDLRDFGLLGFEPSELDLRDYFGAQRQLRTELAGKALVWLRGGNTFLLRYALWRSGADSVLRDLLGNDALTYGGYSAGSCVLAPSLRGLELADDADAVRRVYGTEPVWNGLGLIGEAIVPHYESEDLGGDAARLLVQRYRDDAVPYRTLRDGQVLIVNGPATTII